MQAAKDRRRVVIEGVKPEIDDGRFPIKRTVGESVLVEADIFADGHEAISAVLLYREENANDWSEVPMLPLVNDRWRAQFTVSKVGRYCYTIQGWLDRFKYWSQSLVKRLDAGQDVSVDMLIGAELVEHAVQRAKGDDQAKLQQYVTLLRAGGADAGTAGISPDLATLMYKYEERGNVTTYEHELLVVVDREKAQFSAWYEMFPRSVWSTDTNSARAEHSTFKECEERLTYVASLGFDVLYLPPIHPIGRTHRKGKNNNVVALRSDVGSPWAIGSEEGGHKSINPALGTLEDFHKLVTRSADYGIDIALDIAFQCSPDHPYVKEHPEWFKHRPDGTIQYAENPPKKYEDIYPFDFDSEDWQAMWEELRSIFLYWLEQGVHIFRVDNPHTKSFRFWEWCINSVKREYPDAIFLAEAFTRPKVMYYLAKLGFTQSYNYFPWRNTRWELTEWFTELTQTDVREFFRPNLWPNTPDILTEYMQVGGRPAFITRIVLATTLGASYGIYGPAYELGLNVPIGPGKEEYIDSEKYEIKHWDVNDPNSIKGLMSTLNTIRRENPALQSNSGLVFHPTTNDRLIAYTKSTPELDNVMLMVVNLDPNYTQSGMLDLAIDELGISPNQPYQVHDLLTDARYMWSGRQNYVELDPRKLPAHVFSLRARVRTEKDFDYYL